MHNFVKANFLCINTKVNKNNMKLIGYQVVIAIVILIIFGALLITACAYTWGLLNEIDSTLTNDQKYKAGWAKFGAFLVGFSGAGSILRGLVALGVLIFASEDFEVDV